MCRILLVDDSDVVRNCLVELLKQQSDEIDIVGEASDGCTAVELAKGLRPDAIIMDIEMPIMNGIEASRAILSENPETRIIGLTFADEKNPRTADMLEAGAACCLCKSDDWESQWKRIQQTLAIKNGKTELGKIA